MGPGIVRYFLVTLQVNLKLIINSGYNKINVTEIFHAKISSHSIWVDRRSMMFPKAMLKRPAEKVTMNSYE